MSIFKQIVRQVNTKFTIIFQLLQLFMLISMITIQENKSNVYLFFHNRRTMRTKSTIAYKEYI
jgi:hypothetical protein